MSKWDEYRAWRAKQGYNDQIGSGRDFVLHSPRDSANVARLMFDFSRRDGAHLSDICDLSSFCEDFVLVNRIGISGNFYEYVGPEIASLIGTENFPLFNIDPILNRHRFERTKIPESVLSSDEILSSTQNAITNLRDAFRHSISNFSPVKVGSTYKSIIKFYKESLIYLWRIKQLRTDYLKVSYRSNIIKQHNYFNDILGYTTKPPGWSADSAPIKESIRNAVISQIVTLGMPVSLSSKNIFLKDAMPTNQTAKKIVETITSEIDRMAYSDMVAPSTFRIPPVFSIIVSRCESKKDFLRELVALREEYAGVRAEISKIDEAIGEDSAIADKLRVVKRLDTLKATAIDAAKPGAVSSIVTRTWNIVRDGGLNLKTALSVADSVLKHRNDTLLVGSLSKFVDLASFYANVTGMRSKVEGVFGEIQT